MINEITHVFLCLIKKKKRIIKKKNYKNLAFSILKFTKL